MSDETPIRATLTIEEAGKILGISRNSAYTAAKNGDLPVIKIGSRKLVSKATLDRMLGGQPA